METRRLTGLLALVVLICAIAVLVYYFEYRPQGPEPLPAAVSSSEPAPDESDAPAATTAETPPPAADSAAGGTPAETAPASATPPAATADAPPAAEETAPAATAEAPPAAAAPSAETPAIAETPPAPAEAPGDIASAEPEPAAEPPPAVSAPVAEGIPSFDIVRVEPTGDTVVAGQAAPKARVEILDGNETIAVAEANDDGEWAIPLDKPLPPGTHDLAIRTTSADQKTVTLSDQRVAVSVPTDGSKDVLVVLNAPDAASRVLQEPPAGAASGGAPAGTPAPQGQTSEVASASGSDAGSAPESPQAAADAGSAAATAADQQPAATAGGAPEATADVAPAATAPAAAEGATSPASAPAEQQVAAAPEPTPATPAAQTGGEGASEAATPPGDSATSQSAPPATAGGTDSGGTGVDEPPSTTSAESSGAATSPPAAETPSPDTTIASVEPPADTSPPAATETGPPAAEAPAPQPPAAEPPTAEAPAAPEPPAVESAAPAEPPPAPAPPPPELGVASVEADTSGALFVSGTTNATGTIRVYMEDKLLGEARPDANGSWTLQATRDMPAGTYRVRADQVDESGAVVVRAEVPFEREVEVAILKPVGGAGAATGTKVSGAMPMQTLIIKKGDNLWRLSRTWYGKGKRWATLYTANKDQIRNPRWIYPGQVFMIPAGDTAWKN